jgi:hypothetical protein
MRVNNLSSRRGMNLVSINSNQSNLHDLGWEHRSNQQVWWTTTVATGQPDPAVPSESSNDLLKLLGLAWSRISFQLIGTDH